MSTRTSNSNTHQPNVTTTTHVTENTMNPTATIANPILESLATPAQSTLANFVAGPPPNAVIPPAPAGFTPQKGGFANGTKPRGSELALAPDALIELRGLVNYAAILGQTVPVQADVIQSLDVCAQWSIMRKGTRAWEKYSANEEGVAWTGMRLMMARLGPAFALAVAGDPSLATKYPKLTAFLGAKKAIAKTSASTKKANKKAVAAGKPATHGAVAKKKQKAAAKAALAVEPPPAAIAHAAPVPAVTPVNGATNGAAHL